MVSQKLVDYIINNLDSFGEDKIREALLKEGYPQDLVNNAIKAAIEFNSMRRGYRKREEGEGIGNIKEKTEQSREQLSVKKEEINDKYEKLDKKERNVSGKNSKLLIAMLITIIVLGAGFFVFRGFFNEKTYDIKDDNSLVLALDFENAPSIKDGSIYVADNSKYGNDGFLEENARLIDTQFGKAIEIENGDYIKVLNSNSLDIADAITIEALIYTYNASKFQTIIAKGDNPDWYVAIFNHSVLFHLHEGKDIPNHILLSNTKLEDSVWYVITLTYDGSVMEMYINGEQEEDLTFHNRYWDGGIQVNDHNLLIGINERWEEEYFRGLIKIIRVYNRALTKDEIKNSYLLLEE